MKVFYIYFLSIKNFICILEYDNCYNETNFIEFLSEIIHIFFLKMKNINNNHLNVFWQYTLITRNQIIMIIILTTPLLIIHLIHLKNKSHQNILSTLIEVQSWNRSRSSPKQFSNLCESGTDLRNKMCLGCRSLLGTIRLRPIILFTCACRDDRQSGILIVRSQWSPRSLKWGPESYS